LFVRYSERIPPRPRKRRARHRSNRRDVPPTLIGSRDSRQAAALLLTE
jgi:hypothetical protein